MLTPKSIRRSAPAVVLALAGMGVFVPPAPSAHAASALPALIATAERNTNTVRTLVHHDQMTITAPGGSIRVSSHGTEDEVRNREQDYESVHVTRRAAGGKINTLHYTVDLIFMNGLTYYRTSSAPTQWKSQKGMTFPDPYTRGWKRGRTTVTFPASLVFKDAGTSGGQTHVHAPFATSTVAGSVDLWITTGSRPYIVRQDLAYHATKGPSGSEVSRIKFGPFNRAVNIQPPGQASA